MGDVGEPREEKIAFIKTQLSVAFPDFRIRPFHDEPTQNEVFAIEDNGNQQFLIATRELFCDVDIAGIARRLPALIGRLKDGEKQVWLMFDPTR